MKEVEDIVFSKSSIPSLIMTIILMIIIPIAVFLYWRKKHKQNTNITYLIAGAIGFIVSARILEAGVHYLCLILDHPISRFINNNDIAYIIYGITMAGIFEECGRYIVLKYILKKHTKENAVFYGIGHGGIEIISVLLPTMIISLIIAIQFSKGNIENVLTSLNITKENAHLALPTIQMAASFNYMMMTITVIERILALILHIGLTIIVYFGIIYSKKRFLLIAILLHMWTDMSAGMYQRGILPLWLSEIWILLCVIVIMIFTNKLYKKLS